jgi:hypothetical protein
MDDDWRGAVRRTFVNPDPYAIPEGLPYVALGYRGDHLFFLNGLRAFLACRIGDLSRETVLMGVFASRDNPEALFRLYPRREPNKKTGELEVKPGTYRRAAAAIHVLRLAYEAGVFHPEKQLRGRGAAIDAGRKGNRLALNTGDGAGKGLYLDRQATRLGFYNGAAYVAGAPILIPGRVPPDLGAAVAWLDGALGAWAWTYPTLGPRLVTGWLALAPLSGALPVKPTLAIAGDDRAGRGRLLAFCGALLGNWAALVPEATVAALEEAEGFDTLASIVDAMPGAPVRPPLRRRPLWSADMPPRATPRMRLARSEAATVLELGADDGLLELGLHGRFADDDDDRRRLATARRASGWLMAELYQRWHRLETLFPAWSRLIDAQEGATRESKLIAMLLAGATALRAEADPTEADFFRLEAELSALMLTHRAERASPAEQMREIFTNIVIDPHSITVQQEACGAAGYGSDEAATPAETRSYERTEEQAIAFALNDPMARRAADRIGLLGFKVVGNKPGERQLAIAHSAPARNRALERMGLLEHITARGWTVANTLLQLPDAKRLPGNVWFPGGRGSCRCIAIPLNAVLDRIVGNDPAGVADATEQRGDGERSDG